MKNGARNVRIIAVNAAGKHGFDIFLDFSGQREYLMSHRHNGALYSMLCDGASLDEMRRWRPAAGRRQSGVHRRHSETLHSSVRHLLLVVDDYLLEQAAC